MNVLEKMNELVGTDATKDSIKKWAYDNRVLVVCVHYEEEFEVLEKTVEKFFDDPNHPVEISEMELWDMFLDYEFVA